MDQPLACHMPAKMTDRGVKATLSGYAIINQSLTTLVSTIQDTTTVNGNSLKGVPSLIRMKEWLQSLGHLDNAVNRLNVIHVSGIKGKGSTYAFTHSFLHAHSVRTGFPKKIGLYTGLHLQCFLTLLAFHTFIKEEVDAAIFEVHHGGEYDAINIIQNPVITGIMSLGMDHHKAGIFKLGAPAFSVTQDPGPAEVIQKHALDKGITLTFMSVNECLPTDGRVLTLELTKVDADIYHGVQSFRLTGRFKIIDEGKNVNNEQKCRALIFSHLNKVKPGHVIFTTYQEKDGEPIGKWNTSPCYRELIHGWWNTQPFEAIVAYTQMIWSAVFALMAVIMQRDLYG
ncbi:putative tetrahydrofolylpolyglutamate synthase [Aspergillus novofumigatus IBT 16806]|uniref:Mur ligase n=1 Tax=Aspergillus novofumigatus (strain IBT 16806) TaxID=1392255 RepID=A0A2I1CF98_ASPN1|nr:Mur ligase [Aspergillus novofumigatus IBT 16806]PKX96268.1 Mur ligase [Aspergillus novofumigatus IBT 16806]